MSDSIDSNVASFGAAGSDRSDVPEMASVLEVLTMSVRSTSVTVNVPDVVSPAFVSAKLAELLLPAPTVMVGASLVPTIVIDKVLLVRPPGPSDTGKV